MRDLVGKKYLEKIKANRDNLIVDKVKKYGNDTKEMFEKRFDEIKWCIFTNPNDVISYIRENYSKLAVEKAIVLLKRLGLSEDLFEKRVLIETILVSHNTQGEHYLETIFGMKSAFFHINQDEILGIWSFYSNINMNLVEEYAKKRKIKSSEYLNTLRTTFLKNMGLYSDDLTDEEILNSSEYLQYFKYYNRLIDNFAEELNLIKAEYQNDLKLYNELFTSYEDSKIRAIREAINEKLYDKLNDNDKSKVDSNIDYDPSNLEITALAFNIFDLDEITPIQSFSNENTKLLLNHHSKKSVVEKILGKRIKYLQSIGFDIKILKNIKDKLLFRDWRLIDELKDFLPSENLIKAACEAKNMAYEKFKKYYASSAIIDGDYDIDSNTLVDLSKMNNKCQSFCTEENGKISERIIFINPYSVKDNCLDIHLRHELEHSLTTSIQVLDNGLVIVKIGNQINTYYNDCLINSKLNFYNELQTQAEALKETKEAFANGIYILSSENSEFPKDYTSSNDQYLDSFSLLYSFLPPSACKSAIEVDNDNLYAFIELDELERCEQLVRDGCLFYDDIKFNWRNNKQSNKKKKEIILWEGILSLNKFNQEIRKNYYPLVVYIKEEQLMAYRSFRNNMSSSKDSNENAFLAFKDLYDIIDDRYLYLNPDKLRAKITEGTAYVTRFIDKNNQIKFIDYISKAKDPLETPRIVFREGQRFFSKSCDYYDELLDDSTKGENLMTLGFSLIDDLKRN